MKSTYGFLAFLTIVALSCTPPDDVLERNYQLDPTHTLTLATPDGREILIGDQLDLRTLVQVTDQTRQAVSVPVQAVQYLVNGQARSSPFKATAVGSYTFAVKIGNRVSNTFTVTVLPYKLVRIPVVFHTVNSTLSEAQIGRLVQGMTDAFRNKWNPYNGARDENAVDNFVEFYAAETNPTGQGLTINGLNAVTSSRTTFTSRQAVYEAWSNYWNPNRFLNVWIYDISQEESLSGFAYNLPVTQASTGFRVQSASRTSPDLPYGVYLNKADLNDSRSSTLAHEAGHVLGLNHVFDGNGDESKSCSTTDPDYCADTPYYDRATYMDNYRTLRQRRTACDGTTFVSTNIMDYYLGYENSFTRNQRDRIQYTINYGRWLPSPANNDPRARQGAEMDHVKMPDDYVYVEPLICK
ncbi:M43 family zinc metalloprotease [Persicitalea sp.]|uniref:M43 family zinc metalloprotease n=1 Tax=Persicitalea sp. TaxID=3100273 RepID=UPI0035944238